MSAAGVNNKNGKVEEQQMKSGIPNKILNRLNALRNLQLQTIKLESELCSKVFQLEQEFGEQIKPLLEKREKIVNGSYEPTGNECECEVLLPDDCILSREVSDNAINWTFGSGDGAAEVVKGIPNFWLQVLKNAEATSTIIQEHDEPVLKHLKDITLEYGETTEEDAIKNFTVVFHFSPNEYFKNKRLTKKYEIRVTVDNNEPLLSEFPEIIGCSGCTIQWYPNMNVTVKTLRRKRMNKSDGRCNLVSKTIPRDSFFHFFLPPTMPSNSEESPEIAELLEEHYELGYFMREKLIPNAVLFYTGEAVDVTTDDEEDEEDEYDDDDDEDDSRIANININDYSSINRNDDERDSNSDESYGDRDSHAHIINSNDNH